MGSRTNEARFTLSYCDIEEMLAERGIDVSYETARRWFLKFGPVIAANLRRLRPRPSDHWHLDEMVVRINGRKHWLWRAVDNEGEELDFLVQTRRNAKAAKRLMKKLLKELGFAPTRVVTDRLRSYPAAFKATGLTAHHDRGLRANNRAGTRTFRSDDENANSRASSQPDQPNASSPSTPLPTTPSTINATSRTELTTSSCGQVRSRRGRSHRRPHDRVGSVA